MQSHYFKRNQGIHAQRIQGDIYLRAVAFGDWKTMQLDWGWCQGSEFSFGKCIYECLLHLSEITEKLMKAGCI